MKLKHSVMVGMLGRVADRFHEYQPAADMRQRFEMAKSVQGADGIEIVYPNDFANIDETIRMVKEYELAVSAVNLNVKGADKWQNGSFTNPDPTLRADAVQDLKRTMDLAVELGANMVTCCPLIDGHNYNFQVDYLKQWKWLEEGICEGAQHRSDVRVSLEYKLNELRNYNLLSDMGRTLFLCERLGLAHVGVTMDVGHALIAKETPAEALSLASQYDKLYYVHFNDNAREWDWDMLPGSVNLWDLIEMVFYLKRLDWDGWLSYDVVVREGDRVEGMSASIAIVKMAEQFVNRIGVDYLEDLVKQGLPARTFEQLVKKML